MSRWLNGGPARLYVLVINETGQVLHFERKQDRTTWIKDRFDTYPDGKFSFLTYVQKEK